MSKGVVAETRWKAVRETIPCKRSAKCNTMRCNISPINRNPHGRPEPSWMLSNLTKPDIRSSVS